MKSTIVKDGKVSCPYCGAENSFTTKRTGKAKTLGAVLFVPSIVVMPKRLKCNGCGRNLKRGK